MVRLQFQHKCVELCLGLEDQTQTLRVLDQILELRHVLTTSFLHLPGYFVKNCRSLFVKGKGCLLARPDSFFHSGFDECVKIGRLGADFDAV